MNSHALMKRLKTSRRGATKAANGRWTLKRKHARSCDRSLGGCSTWCVPPSLQSLAALSGSKFHNPYQLTEPVMDTMLLRLFQRHVLLQCKYIIVATHQLNAALAAGQTEMVFYAIQSLLSSQANISKALWGEGGKAAIARGRERLRTSIGVDDYSPLNTTDMRNNYDHYDSRLEQWWNESTQRNYVELSIMPRGTVGGTDIKDVFRSYDPATKSAWFWDQQLNLQAIVDEVNRILPKLTAETSKPHWDEGAEQSSE